MKTAFIVLSLISIAVHAQPIYKCDINGVVSYGDQPCDKGLTQLITPPAPTENSAATLARQQRMSEQLAATRHQREAQDAREQERMTKLASQQHKKCAALTLQRRWAEQDAASATGRDAAKRTLKARRASEQLASACPIE